MPGLVPFNRNYPNILSTGFGDFYNMLDDFFSDSLPLRRTLINDTFKVDVQENEKSYVVEAELPGVQKNEIGLSVEEGRLQISVKREEETEDKKSNYLHRERRFTSMSRNIYLGDADGSGIKAQLDNGVLCIVVPKKEKEESVLKIEVE